MSEIPEQPNEGELILYQTAEGTVRIEVLYESETFWLNQKRIADLFGVEIHTVSYHLKEIYASGELAPEATLRKIRRVQTEGNREVRREIEFYNLDAIISVGYRVNSSQATQFRIWATQTLREFVIKGFVLDDERLKLNKRFGKDYFDELLERIREIRASERRFYLKITDIYEQCSIDYDKTAEITQTFFKTVQNKLHWAVTGKTAAEIIAERADSSKPSMGLTTWKNAPAGKILKSDVSIAKNYLIEVEIKELERIVTMYLDYAENQAARQIPMKMTDWIINEQKATVIVEHLTYDMVDDRHNSDIFTREKPKEDFSKAIKTDRHIYDYVFTDSKNERAFVTELDTSVEVVVYAKLPKSFTIPTPVGSYNPDWAIAFQEGLVKHVYFIAETKGSMSSMELRKIEECKIDCARKFFSKITSDQVKYDVVDSYGKLMALVK